MKKETSQESSTGALWDVLGDHSGTISARFDLFCVRIEGCWFVVVRVFLQQCDPSTESVCVENQISISFCFFHFFQGLQFPELPCDFGAHSGNCLGASGLIFSILGNRCRVSKSKGKTKAQKGIQGVHQQARSVGLWCVSALKGETPPTRKDQDPDPDQTQNENQNQQKAMGSEKPFVPRGTVVDRII